MKFYKLGIHETMGGSESTSAEKAETKLETREDVNDTQREFRSERADALRWTTSDLGHLALGGSTQSSTSVETGGLLSFFLDLGFPSPWLEQRGPQLSRRTRRTLDNPGPCGRLHRRTCRGCC